MQDSVVPNMTESLKRLRWLVSAAALISVPGFGAAAPVLYSAPAHESPVRADPDDLLLLPGDGLSASDRVAYRSARGVRGIAGHPAASAVPAEPTATIGYADVVGTSDVPRTLTIRLPRV